MATVWLQLGAVTSFLAEDKSRYETQAADIAWIVIYLYIIVMGFATHEWKAFNRKIQSLHVGQGMKQHSCIWDILYFNMSVIDAINIPSKLSIIPRWIRKEVISTFNNYIYYDLYTHVNYDILFPYIFIKWQKTKIRWGPPLLHWSHFYGHILGKNCIYVGRKIEDTKDLIKSIESSKDTMAKRKRTTGQTIIYKTLHRQPKFEQPKLL